MRSLAFVFFSAVVALTACTGDDSSGGSPTQNGPAPSGCPAQPCQVGTQCYQPAAGNCSGVWYCWTDATWHCAPPDASAPGGDGGPIVFPEGGGGDDASQDATADVGSSG